MAEPARIGGDRLPWLTEVPKTPPPLSPQRAAKRKPQLPWLAFLLGALFTLIGVGAYWLGSRQGVPEPVGMERPGMAAQTEHAPSAAQPQPDAATAVTDVAETAPPPTPISREEATAERRLAEAERVRAERRPSPRRATPKPKTNVQAAENSSGIPAQPVVRGRIIQTGAFATRALAEADWQRMVRRWPYLATKPRLISPIEVRSTDGRATRMYRVQLATASQAQSVVICQQLEKARQSCVVIY